MRNLMGCFVAACLLLLPTGCDMERAPGPHESEYGTVLFWSIADDQLTWGESCSDAEDLRGALNVPQLQEDTFLMYRLSEDGGQAVLQDCTSTDASTCVDSEADVVLEVDGNTLTADRGIQRSDIEDADCRLEQNELWTLTDEGETLVFLRELHLDLEGDECPSFESWLEEQSPNGEGIVGCVVSLQADAIFYSSGSPQ